MSDLLEFCLAATPQYENYQEAFQHVVKRCVPSTNDRSRVDAAVNQFMMKTVYRLLPHENLEKRQQKEQARLKRHQQKKKKPRRRKRGIDWGSSSSSDDSDEADPDLINDAEDIATVCPLSKQFIRVPVRLKTCQHSPVCDLESWVAASIHKRSARLSTLRFVCPHCGTDEARADDLEVDLFLLRSFREVLLNAAAKHTTSCAAATTAACGAKRNGLLDGDDETTDPLSASSSSASARYAAAVALTREVSATSWLPPRIRFYARERRFEVIEHTDRWAGKDVIVIDSSQASGLTQLTQNSSNRGSSGVLLFQQQLSDDLVDYNNRGSKNSGNKQQQKKIFSPSNLPRVKMEKLSPPDKAAVGGGGGSASPHQRSSQHQQQQQQLNLQSAQQENYGDEGDDGEEQERPLFAAATDDDDDNATYDGRSPSSSKKNEKKKDDGDDDDGDLFQDDFLGDDVFHINNNLSEVGINPKDLKLVSSSSDDSSQPYSNFGLAYLENNNSSWNSSSSLNNSGNNQEGARGGSGSNSVLPLSITRSGSSRGLLPGRTPFSAVAAKAKSDQHHDEFSQQNQMHQQQQQQQQQRASSSSSSTSALSALTSQQQQQQHFIAASSPDPPLPPVKGFPYCIQCKNYCAATFELPMGEATFPQSSLPRQSAVSCERCGLAKPAVEWIFLWQDVSGMSRDNLCYSPLWLVEHLPSSETTLLHLYAGRLQLELFDCLPQLGFSRTDDPALWFLEGESLTRTELDYLEGVLKALTVVGVNPTQPHQHQSKGVQPDSCSHKKQYGSCWYDVFPRPAYVQWRPELHHGGGGGSRTTAEGGSGSVGGASCLLTQQQRNASATTGSGGTRTRFSTTTATFCQSQNQQPLHHQQHQQQFQPPPPQQQQQQNWPPPSKSASWQQPEPQQQLSNFAMPSQSSFPPQNQFFHGGGGW